MRSPARPSFYWGNLLLFERPPRAGDGERWERLFEAEFASPPGVRHRTFAWESTDGEVGAAAEEFLARGYDLERLVGLVASLEQLRPHPRENRAVAVRRLDPRAGRDEELWRQVLELEISGRDPRITEHSMREHRSARQAEQRALFLARGGGCYVALDPADGAVLASLGLLRGPGRVSVQEVETVASHRRKGICSRLLVEAVRDLAARESPPAQVVICADPDYHALGLYESLGFVAREHCAGVCRLPTPA